MGHVLYEASSFNFCSGYLIPIMMVIFIAIFPFWFRKRYYLRLTKEQKAKFDSDKTFMYIFISIMSICVLLGAFGTYLVAIDEYNKIVKAYQQGNYEIVEGYVENFDPMPYTGHKSESFDINGVSFSYSDYYIMQGYNNAQSHGGVITGDGQHLRIGYVYYHGGNRIVYIEKLD